MEIKPEDLKVGDVILILGQVSKCVRIINQPVLGKPKVWRPNDPWFKSLAVQCNIQLLPKLVPKWDYKTKTYLQVSRTVKTYILEPPTDLSPLIRVDLNYNRLWLIERINF